MQIVVTVQLKATEGQSKPRLFHIAWDRVWEDGNNRLLLTLCRPPRNADCDALPFSNRTPPLRPRCAEVRLPANYEIRQDVRSEN
jgi:hypothetical protein